LFKLLAGFESLRPLIDIPKLPTGNSEEPKITHADSQACPFIQSVDFVAGAINRKYRKNEDLYFKMIQHRIVTVLDYEP